MQSEIIAFFVWCLLALAIPLVLIVTGGFKYKECRDVWEIISRLILAFLIYFPATLLLAVPLGGMLNAMAHGKIPSPAEKLFCFALIFIYALVGCFLWLMVKSDFIKPLLIFRRHHNKPQTIFEEDEK
jgi:fumarate reductase subunit D